MFIKSTNIRRNERSHYSKALLCDTEVMDGQDLEEMSDDDSSEEGSQGESEGSDEDDVKASNDGDRYVRLRGCISSAVN